MLARRKRVRARTSTASGVGTVRKKACHSDSSADNGRPYTASKSPDAYTARNRAAPCAACSHRQNDPAAVYAVPDALAKKPNDVSDATRGAIPASSIARDHWCGVVSPPSPSHAAATAAPSMSPGTGKSLPRAVTCNGPGAMAPATTWASSCLSTGCGAGAYCRYTSDRHGFAMYVSAAPIRAAFCAALAKRNTVTRRGARTP